MNISDTFKIRPHNIFLFSLLLISVRNTAQIKLTSLSESQIPKTVKWEGKIKNAVKFTDALGEHLVITSETGIYFNKKFKHEGAGSDAELFAYHFLLKNDSVKQTWKVYDFIKDCPVDIECNYLKNTFEVTDLDKDGVAEIWLMYKTVCHGDISASDMKIIMYQGQQKFAMRGRNKVQISEKEYDGGEYKFDKVFNDGPQSFRDFAKKMWDKNIMQVFGE